MKMKDTKFPIANEETGIIWNQVCQSEMLVEDLADGLKMVTGTGRGAFTSIDAYTQLKKATEIFGPMGTGFGLKDVEIVLQLPITKETRNSTVEGVQLFFSANFWYIAQEEMHYFPVMTDIFVDTSGDTAKKVITDMLTKALSYLGWNYDVFCGRFNDSKSIQSKATDAEKNDLRAILKGMKEAAAKKVIDYHEKRGWLKDEVQTDIKKLRTLREAADKAKADKEASAEQAELPMDEAEKT